MQWVTRKHVHVNRTATAWLMRRFLDPRAEIRFVEPNEVEGIQLIRRFVDPGARFRFADSQSPEAGPGEVRFDTVGGELTHEGDRCTFETLLARLALGDPALSQIAEIVHDIDMKDGKFERADAAGISQLVTGLVLAHPDDLDRLDRGFALLDDLYESFRRRLPTRPPAAASGPLG